MQRQSIRVTSDEDGDMETNDTIKMNFMGVGKEKI